MATATATATANGHADNEDHAEAGMTISEVVDLVQRRASTQHIVQDYIYTKVGNKLRKVSLDDILFIEVEGKYSALQVRDRKYNVKASLKDLAAQVAFRPLRPCEPEFCGEPESDSAHRHVPVHREGGRFGNPHQPHLQGRADAAHQPHLRFSSGGI